MKNKWYVATIIVRSRVGNDDNEPWLCDEQIHLIKAPDEDTAYLKAIELGKEKEDYYKNDLGETVFWEFFGLVDLEELDVTTIQDGVEIRSRLFDNSNPNNLINDKTKLTVYVNRATQEQIAKRKELSQVS
jgi:hypothetical protein